MEGEQNNQSQNNSAPAPEQNQSNGSQNSVPNFTTNNNSTVIAALSYIGPLVIVSYLMSKDSEFVKFHAKQGLIVFGIEVLAWIISSMMYGFGLYMIFQLVHLATLILSIVGIVNVVQSQKKELPVVGSWSKNFNI